jgi:hypothetical protein
VLRKSLERDEAVHEARASDDPQRLSGRDADLDELVDWALLDSASDQVEVHCLRMIRPRSSQVGHVLVNETRRLRSCQALPLDLQVLGRLNQPRMCGGGS